MRILSVLQNTVVLMALSLGIVTACTGAEEGASEDATEDAGDAPFDVADVGDEVLLEPQVACIDVIPGTVVFGGRKPTNLHLLPIQIVNCSTTAALEIFAIAFKGQDGPETTCVGPFCATIAPERGIGGFDASTPLIIAAKERLILNVVYTPTQEAELGANGQPILDEATLLITSNAPGSIEEISVSGFGAFVTCPIAIARVAEGEEVIPQTVLHLDGGSSTSNVGNITAYEWSVEQPLFSASKFIPTNDYPTPSFEANVAGKYTFRLDVWNADGLKSCAPAKTTVFVVPDEAIHVELLWTSPGDPNPFDEGPLVGTDLDLHFTHPNASEYDLDGDGIEDPWFDLDWDTFWYWPQHDWGNSNDFDDNPSLDRDDVDTNGPENFNFNAPEDGLTYAIGVNYWDDHGFGTSFAAARVYVYGQMVFEVKDVVMYDHDMWWVAKLAWPSGEVTEKLKDDGSRWITHDYHHPDFYQP